MLFVSNRYKCGHHLSRCHKYIMIIVIVPTILIKMAMTITTITNDNK